MALPFVTYSGFFNVQIMKDKANAYHALRDHDFFNKNKSQTLHKQIKVLPIAY